MLQHMDYLLQTAVPAWQLDDEGCELVRSAAMLHEVGMDISHAQFHRHGAYILVMRTLALPAASR